MGGPKAQASAWARLHARLCERRDDIEEAAFTRICAIADPTDIADPAYREGLRHAVSAAFDYGFNALEHGTKRVPPIPVALLAQARLAARNGVSLDTVMRRYFAGYAVLGDHMVEEGSGLLSEADLKAVLSVQAVLLDGVLAAVGEEFRRELAGVRPQTSEQYRARLVECLLDGEFVDPAAVATELSYDFDACHTAVTSAGPNGWEAISTLAAQLDCRPLLVRRPEQAVWGWMAARRRLDPTQVEALAESSLPHGTALALGEPANGLSGWRLTHRQAAAALPIARRSSAAVARYGDVALLASAYRDDLLLTSLHQLYLAPLEGGRDRGEVARQTLRAYFATGCNTSSAAAALGVKRHTVTNRLRAVEEKLGQSLATCTPDIESALRLEELNVYVTVHARD